jgi:hypothetical protein
MSELEFKSTETFLNSDSDLHFFIGVKVQTFEFKVKPQECLIKLPPHFQQWDDKQVRIILLIEEIDAPKPKDRYAFDAISLNTKGFRFNRE